MIVSCYKRDRVMGGGGIQENDNGGNVEVETMAMAMVGFGLLFKNAILPLDRLINSIVMSIGGGRIGVGVDGLFCSTIGRGHSGGIWIAIQKRDSAIGQTNQ